MNRSIPALATGSLCLTAVLALVLSGCASIVHGTTQDVGISSTPSNARVTINGADVGGTPLTTSLSRKDHHTLRVTLDGYLPYEATFTRTVSGWVWGNLVFGGLIGLAVDAISGGLYKLTPEQLHAQLERGGAGDTAALDGADIYLAVVLEPDPAWERIGGLEKD